VPELPVSCIIQRSLPRGAVRNVSWNYIQHSAFYKTLKPLIVLRSARTVVPACLGKQLKCFCKILTKFAAKFHTDKRSSSYLIAFLSPIRLTACAHAQCCGCYSTTDAHSETGQMALCCQNLTLGSHSCRSALSMLVGALCKKFGLFLNTPHIVISYHAVNTLHFNCCNKTRGVGMA
jgi:hypothetical protein